MGATDKKVSLLPAPTESESTTGGTEFDSRITDKTSYSLPEDGSPITIATRRRGLGKDDFGLNSNKSQTSLLIEYFEGGRGSQSESRKPSVRVKVRPSSKTRSKSSSDHIQISTRKSTLTKRAQVSDKVTEIDRDVISTASYQSLTDLSNLTSKGSGPIEVEITPRRHASPLIPPTGPGQRSLLINPSEISSVAHDSFLDGHTISSDYYKLNQNFNPDKVRTTGASVGLMVEAGAETLKTSVRSRSRSLSRERIVAQKAVEKVRSDNSRQRRRKHSSRSRSVSSDLHSEAIKPPKKSSHGHNIEPMVSGADSSLLNSHLSGKSADVHSFRSGATKSSINNPKLLETVEDAIRRLILPELSALKREQSKHNYRDRRISATSGSYTSRGSKESNFSDRKSERVIKTDEMARPEVRLNDDELLPGTYHKLPLDNNHKTSSENKFASKFQRETSIETVIHEDEKFSRERGIEKQHQQCSDAIATGADIQELNKLLSESSLESLNQAAENDQRRRRLETYRKSYGRSESMSDTSQRAGEFIPPMPLMNDNNTSEITRSSILSAVSEMAHLTNQELTAAYDKSRGAGSPILRSPNRTPVTLQKSLGIQHSNYSRENLSLVNIRNQSPPLRSTEYDLDEHGRKVIRREFHDRNEFITNDSSLPTSSHHETTVYDGKMSILRRNQGSESVQEKAHYFYQDIPEVPPPLKYIPYSQERRGLSPIPSVSGWTEGEPENQRDSRLTRSVGSYSSIGRNAIHRRSGISNKSFESMKSHENPYDFAEVRQGGLADSEISQDIDYWEEQHRENDRNRNMEEPNQTDYNNTASYASMYMEGHNLDEPNASNFKTKIDLVRQAADVESAVASIVNASELTGGTGIQSNLDAKGFPSVTDNRHEIGNTKRWTDVSENKDLNQPENVLDSSDVTATKEEDHDNKYEGSQNTFESPEQKSFKERALEITGLFKIPRKDIEKRSSQEEYQLSASGLPDLNNPMPELGFGPRDSDILTNPSIVSSQVDEIKQTRTHWSVRSSSPQHSQTINPVENINPESYKETEIIRDIDDLTSGQGADNYIKEPNDENDEESQRGSSDRKRDTLVTNPYENTSPVAAADALDHGIQGFQGFLPSKLSYPARDNNSSMHDAASNNRSQGGAVTPETVIKETGDSDNVGCDPFYTPKNQRPPSGMSHGMCSPIYDSSTGNGIDRIESKDIIALMDHLTVRDAQRSARDTEILVTLVRAAAEMRNSFEDMKRLLADTEDVIITEVQANTDRSVQKIMYGPRPPPQSGRRSLRQVSFNEIYDDIPAKKRNVFRRALKGLSLKSANDLGKIEEMLVQLLGEVEGLKVAQGLKPINHQAESSDRLNRANHDLDHENYENEGNPSISTLGHGPPDVPKGCGMTRMFECRKFSDHRISTVPEGDEHGIDRDDKTIHNSVGKNDRSATPMQEAGRRGSTYLTCSSPSPGTNPNSNSNTPPHVTNEKCKKQKSSSSGWIPKVSRWSENTASTVLRGLRSNGRYGGRKNCEWSPSSRSGSDLENSPENQLGSCTDKFDSRNTLRRRHSSESFYSFPRHYINNTLVFNDGNLIEDNM